MGRRSENGYNPTPKLSFERPGRRVGVENPAHLVGYSFTSAVRTSNLRDRYVRIEKVEAI